MTDAEHVHALQVRVWTWAHAMRNDDDTIEIVGPCDQEDMHFDETPANQIVVLCESCQETWEEDTPP